MMSGLSREQLALWSLVEVSPHSATFHVTGAVRIATPFNGDAMRTSLARLVARHPALRTTFTHGGAATEQIHATIAPSGQLDFEIVEADAAALTDRLRHEADRLFDLQSGPLFRARVFVVSGDGPNTAVLQIVLHPIIADSRSLQILMHELGVMYRAEPSAPARALEPLTTSYADYVDSQSSLLASNEGERLAAYWRARLTDELALVDVPIDRVRSPLRSFQIASVSADITACSAGLERVAHAAGTTRDVVMFAAYCVLLHRYTGKDELVIGYATPGRANPRWHATIGRFENVLPVPVKLARSMPFNDLVTQVGEAFVDGARHADYPLDRLQPSHDPARSTIFQAAFVTRDSSGDLAAFTDQAHDEPVELPPSTSRHDLTLVVSKDRLSLEYNRELFDADSVGTMLGQLQRLLAEVVVKPHCTVEDLPLASDEELQRSVVVWNRTASDYPSGACIHDVFASHVARTPDAIAVIFEGETLTYRELDHKANALAHELRSRGVGPEVIVGICTNRSLDLMVAIFGVLKAGGAYLALDAAYPSDRLEFMLRDCATTLILSHEHLVARMQSEHAGTTVLDIAEYVRAVGAPQPPAPLATPENLAYVMYTSGSTGTPKGVMSPHRAIVVIMSWAIRTVRLGPGDRIVQSRSPSFDVSVWEIAGALLSGATLLMAKHQDASYLARLMKDQGATIATFVPSELEVLLTEEAFRTCKSLRAVLIGSEVLTPALCDRLLAVLDVELSNNYAPTETTIVTNYFRYKRGRNRATVPIGPGVGNATMYVLDHRMRPCPVGVPGDLYIGGLSLARGYRNRPGHTAEKFVPDPFTAVPGARMYRTGDLARWLPEGAIDFLGRADHQVKIRGFRVELGEVEATLGAHPAVRNVIVVVHVGRNDRRLIAYVTANVDTTVSTRELRAYAHQRLPDYMVPSTFVVLDEMPFNPNGKIDRKALPAPAGRDVLETEYVAPRNPVEEHVAAVFAELLQVERVGVDDHFFELGGSSLVATQVVSRIRQLFSVELPIRSLFEHPTVAGIGAAVDEARKAPPEPAASRIEPVRRDGDLELSFAQHRLWFMDRYEPDSPFYNESRAMQLTGQLDAAALGRSLEALVARHESLRTRFPTKEGRPVQVVEAARTTRLPLVDLTHIADETQRIAEATRRAVELARLHFDLATDPLLRVQLIRLSATEHWLVIVMHHIIGDDWSMAVLWREVAAFYNAITSSTDPGLAPLAIQYPDFAAWHRRWLSGEVLDKQLHYWKQQLHGSPSLLELPTDRPRPPVMTYRGAHQEFQLPAALAASLNAVSRQESATLFMALLAAFQTLLHRYSGQRDIAIGSPVANRNREETEGLIGFFVNTLVLRTDFSGEPTFRDLLARVREVVLGAITHQDVPFEKLVEELQPQRSTSHSPLFQVVFAMDYAPANAQLAGLRHDRVDFDIGISKFDLNLTIEERPDGLHGTVEYNTDLYDAATIARMMGHFERLLVAIVADPGQRISALSLLGEAERNQLVVEWNATTTEYPRDRCVHELFEAQVDRTPESIALVFGNESLTYRELDRRANQLAHHLAKLGVGPDVLVGICVERSLEMVIGALGILKAGGAYVPLDPSYPAERLAFMMEDAAVTVLVTLDRLAGVLPAHDAAVVRLDTAEIAHASTARPAAHATADHLAYVDFTSGSTGRPKGACVPHRAVARLVLNTSYLDIRPDDVFLQMSPLAFDASTLELWGPLLNGAKLAILAPHAPSLEELGRVIVQRGVTVLWLTSGLFQQMVDHQLDDLANLRCLLAGGDVLSVAHVKRVVERLGCTLINGYGPTENTTFTCCYPIPRQLPAGASVPIGRPIANTTVYVLDAAGEPVPIGLPGELYTGGDGLARGYLHRPNLTAERFVPNPFGTGRLYRTGDRVRWRPDGNIEFIGRIDDQIKLRGFRIELGEIEAVLGQELGVREVIAMVREDVPGDKRVVAYVVGEALDGTELRARLKGKLPEYMVPSVIVVLDALPLSPNGKVDRKALRAPELATTTELVAPRTPTEVGVAQIFAEILHVPAGALDDFFALGGHSLLATQVISRVRTTLGIELPLRTLFEAPTVVAFAERIDAVRSDSVTQVIGKLPRNRALELSFAQERLWFLDQLEPGIPHYNVPIALALRGRLDERALQRSLQAVVARHESLRTTFVSHDGRAVQVIAPAPEVELPVIDLGDVALAVRPAEAMRRAVEEARKPFDLERGPLLHASILKLGPDEHWLVVSIHHIVTDAWSVGIFLRELAAGYEAFSAGKEPALPALPIQYADFAAWQRGWLEGEVLDDQLRYWKEQLRGVPALLELSTDRPRPPVMSYAGASQSFQLPESLATALRALSRDASATLFMTLLAAFQALLQRYSGQDDIVVGSPVANRNREEIEGVFGFFTNTLVLRTDLSGDPTFRELLRRVREVALGAYGHQDLPFDKLVAELHPERSLSYSPLFQVMFVMQNVRALPDLPALEQRLVELDTGTAKFDLTLFLDETETGLHGSVEYNSDLYDAQTIARMIGHYDRLLHEIVSNPDRAISALPLLTQPEREQLVLEWNATERPYGDDTCIHELFEQQVDRIPDALAMVAGAEQLTYRELDARANQLAHHLRACGVGPGELVGIFLERSSDLVIALLGVLKSGAAYVPLDPTYPKDRLAFIQEDARPKVLITQTSLGGKLPEVGSRIVGVETDAAEIARSPVTRPARIATRTNLSHVIFTSGSTGRPKGVAIEHGVMVNYCRFSRDLHPPGELRVFLFATSVCFDMSLFELFVPLAWGGRVVVVDDLFSLPSLVDAGVTMVNAVPSVLTAYLRAGALPPTLEAVSCAGEALPNTLVQQLHAAGVRRVYDFYGPTETFIATWTLRSGEGTPIIGRPIANSQIYLLDRHGALVPRGLRGELYVGGDGLARGYLNRPELTAERFVPNPFGPGRLYRTGDVARWLPDGTLSYMGRIDHQVKIRGFRVEPGEIEVLLLSHPQIREAAVIAREDTPGDRRLVAYVVGKSKLVVNELRAYLKERLPDYMVPSAFVVLDALPQTPNGKIDRKALPAPEGGRGGVERAFVAPRTPMETRLAEIWSEILAVPLIGVHDNFFELGGHSLLATQVVSRIRQTFEVELPLRSLFEESTVAGFAATVEAARHRKPDTAVARIERVDRNGELGLSFAQQRMWFLDHLEPGSAFYIVFDAVQFRGVLDIVAIERSLTAIAMRHESLRTTFETRHGRAVQVIAPSLEVRVPVIDLSGLLAAARTAEANRLMIEEAHQPFDLATGPLFRASVLRLGDKEHLMLLAMHHSITDGWSVGVFWRELAVLYRAFSTGSEPELPALEIQYADFAAWQRTWLSGSVLDAQLQYWKQQLAGSPSLLELPTDRQRPSVMSYRGTARPFELSAALAASLQALSRTQSTTLFMTLLAAFQVLLHRYTGQADIVVGSPVANRNRAETEGLIGFFVNTLVLRTDLSGDPTFRELLGRVREVALGAFGHQDIPFEKLVEELQPERTLSHAPLFQVMFVLQNAPLAPELPGLDLDVVELDQVTSKFDLTLAMEERAGGLFGRIEYSTDLFDETTIAQLIEHFERLLEGLAADPERRISAVPIVGPTEREKLVVEWNATVRSYPDLCVHQLFEAQVDRTPDAIALELGSERLTYRELDGRANQLAAYLRELGVGPEVLVGVCFERSPEMVVGVLAILKAGGAYLPIDPSYPNDRIAFMLDDTRVPLVLAHAATLDRLPDVSRLVSLDGDQAQIAAHASERIPNTAGAHNLAYVIYTSGSTGRPKGAAIEHGGLTNYLVWALEAYAVDGDAGAPVHSSLSFDLTVTSLYLPLLAGARVTLVRDDDVEALAASLTTRGGHRLVKITPAHLDVLARQLQPEVAAHASHGYVIGGEALRGESLMFWRAHAPSVRLWNEYGPTETVVGCCVYELPIGETPTAALPIGRPIANTRLYILDARLEPTPTGVGGELYIGGDGVARGYLGRPALTAERFVPDPFGPPGSRLYRTGDLARYRADGVLEYIGRLDHQVKIRGFRIELGEIEAALARQPGIRDVVVVVREDSPGDKRLVAYIVGQPELAGGHELRASLKTTLPEYMIPSAFVVLDELPLTLNGKVDRNAIMKILPTGEAGTSYLAPRTLTELELARIFGELLRVPVVGARDDFFELGGHSLLAVQLFAVIADRLGVVLPVSTLFRAPTVEALARELDDKPTQQRSLLVPLRPSGSGTPLVCIHPGGGTVFCYQQLIARLSPGRPCFGLESRGLVNGEAPAETIEDMAAAYVRSLLEERPAGPYHLMGWSFGGVVAIEMARMLVAAGHEVTSTTLLDTFAPAAFPSDAVEPAAAIEMFAHDLGLDIVEGELAALGPAAALDRVADLAHQAGLLPTHLGVDHLARRVSVFATNLRAYKRYEPGTIAGRVTLIRAQDTVAGDGVDPADGWRDHLSQLDVKVAPGSHYSMIEVPNVDELARLLDAAIADVSRDR